MRSPLSAALSAAALFAALVSGEARAEDAAVPQSPQIRHITYSDGFLLHDDRGMVRLYPHVSLTLDFGGTLGAGVSALKRSDGSKDLNPRFSLRRAMIELGGGAFGYLDMKLAVDFNGRGVFGDPLLQDPRDIRVGIPNAWINGEFGPALNLMVGIQPTPFSLERRTDPDDLSSLEPSLASQLAVPFSRVLGATLWGVTLHKTLGYDISGITGVGNTLPSEVAEYGVAARVFYRPFSDRKPNLREQAPWREQIYLDRLQVGASVRLTDRDDHSSEAARDDLTTGRGFALFRRRFTDANGRTQVILPSGTQRAFGFEVVIPLPQCLSFTSELYTFDDETREALLGRESTTLRQGRLRGTGWYTQLSWVVENVYQNRTPFRRKQDVRYSLSRSLDAGLFPHPERRDPVGVRSEIGALTKFQLLVRAGHADAVYLPAILGQQAASQAANLEGRAGRINVWEVSAVASVYTTRIGRLSLSWQAYHAPAAGTADNRAVLPGQLTGRPDARFLHEITVRGRFSL